MSIKNGKPASNYIDYCPSLARRLTFAILFAFATFVLQVGLPLISSTMAGKYNAIDDVVGDVESSNWREFWKARLRFHALIHPDRLFVGLRYPVSMAMHEDELIALISRRSPFDDPTEVIRFNVRSGRASTSVVSNGVQLVISDGNQAWWVSDKRRVFCPLVWDGHVRALAAENDLRRIVELIDGHWRDTDQFPLIPIDMKIIGPSCVSSDTIDLRGDLSGHIFYRRGIDVGSKADALAFLKHHRDGGIISFSEEQLNEYNCRDLQYTDETGYIPYPFGRWFEHGLPCSMCSFPDPDDDHPSGFLWSRYGPGNFIESRYVSSPIPWGYRYGESITDNCAFISFDSRVYILSHSRLDGRMHVMLWENGKLNLVAQRGSSLISRVCLDAGCLCSLAIAIPMCVLCFLAFGWQRRQPRRTIVAGNETVVLASVIRRGVARSIDLCTMLLPLYLSIVCHPDVMGWWVHGARKLSRVIDSFTFLLDESPLQRFVEFRQEGLEFLGILCGAPFLSYLLLLSLIILIIQVIWQGRTGYTLGKRILGIRVVRKSLKTCGVARSLLRELLVALDSLFLLSWVPGVVSIVLSTHSQRIGDYLTETIVIKVPSHFN